MATRYVSPSGTLIADGLSAVNAVSKLRIAELNSTTGDEIIITGTSAAAPLFGGATIAADGVYRGNGMQYLCGARKILDGEYIGSGYDYYFQEAAYPVDGWSESVSVGGTVTATASGLIGANYVKCAGTATAAITRQFRVKPGSTIRLTVIAKAAAGSDVKIQLKHDMATDTWYNFSTQAWGASAPGYAVIGAGSGNTDWTAHQVVLMMDADTENAAYQVYIGKTSAQEVDIQAFFIETITEWTQYSGDVYQTPLVSNSTAGTVVKTIWKATSLLDKDEDAVRVTKSASLAAIAAGEFYHETGADLTDNVLYYKLNTGETLATLQAQIFWASHTDYSIKLDNNMVTVSDLTVGGASHGVYKTDGTGTFTNFDIIEPQQVGFQCKGGAATWRYGRVKNAIGTAAAHGDAVLADSTGTGDGNLTCHGVRVDGSGDECFQVIENATLKLYGCYGINPGVVTGSGGNTLSIENSAEETTTLEVYGGYFESSVSAPMRHQNDGTSTIVMKGVVLKNSTTAQATVLDSDTVASDWTSSNNYYDDTTSSVQDTVGAGFTGTSIDVADHFGTDENGLPTLLSNSSLIGQGPDKWWGTDNPRPVSANGRPIPDFDIDPGLQSPHGSFHPSKL